MKVKITDNSGNQFDIDHPGVKDIESAKTFLMDNHPFFCCEEDFENVQFDFDQFEDALKREIEKRGFDTSKIEIVTIG